MKRAKFYKIAFIVESCVLLLLLGLYGLASLFDDSSERLLLRESSPSGAFGVTVYEVGSAFLFGPNTVRVYFGEDGTVPTFFTTKISNDGGPVNAETNILLGWEGDTAVLTLHGSEQLDVTYRLSAGEYETGGEEDASYNKAG